MNIRIIVGYLFLTSAMLSFMSASLLASWSQEIKARTTHLYLGAITGATIAVAFFVAP